jgi:hypothetical protein
MAQCLNSAQRSAETRVPKEQEHHFHRKQTAAAGKVKRKGVQGKAIQSNSFTNICKCNTANWTNWQLDKDGHKKNQTCLQLKFHWHAKWQRTGKQNMRV